MRKIKKKPFNWRGLASLPSRWVCVRADLGHFLRQFQGRSSWVGTGQGSLWPPRCLSQALSCVRVTISMTGGFMERLLLTTTFPGGTQETEKHTKSQDRKTHSSLPCPAPDSRGKRCPGEHVSRPWLWPAPLGSSVGVKVPVVGDTQGPSVSQSSPRGTRRSPFLLRRVVKELESQTELQTELGCALGGVPRRERSAGLVLPEVRDSPASQGLVLL